MPSSSLSLSFFSPVPRFLSRKIIETSKRHNVDRYLRNEFNPKGSRGCVRSLMGRVAVVVEDEIVVKGNGKVARGFNGRCLRVEPIIHGVLMIVPRRVPLGLFGRCWTRPLDDNLSNKRGREEWGKNMPSWRYAANYARSERKKKNLIRGTDFIEGF